MDAPAGVTYANRVAGKLSAGCPTKTPVDVPVIASTEANGSALPGGFPFVNPGLIDASVLENWSILAAGYVAPRWTTHFH